MAIRLTGTILKESCDPQKDFIGHVGGDDFIVIFRSRNWQKRCQRMLDRFAHEILELYDDAHRKVGGIEAQDRRGNAARYDFISLSIGATTYHGDTTDHGHDNISHHDISSQAAEAKKQAKKIPGNALFINRRKQKFSRGAAFILSAKGQKASLNRL